jgi:hypothetical protein
LNQHGGDAHKREFVYGVYLWQQSARL